MFFNSSSLVEGLYLFYPLLKNSDGVDMLKQLCLGLFLFAWLPIVLAGDLDGGIPSNDEAISDELQVAPNIAFIKRNAKAKANNGTAESDTSSGGVGNVSSTCTKNCTIVNLSNNKGATSVSDK